MNPPLDIQYRSNKATDPSRGRSRRIRAGATAAALVIHGLLLAFLLGSASGRALTNGAGQASGEEKGIEVTLVGRRGTPAPQSSGAAASKAADPLQQMMRRARADSQVYVPAAGPAGARQGDLAKLFESIERRRAEAKAKSDPGEDGSNDGRTSAKGDHAEGRVTDVATPSGGAALSSGQLWSQISRCWRPQGATVTVTLEVVLDGQGRIAVPPRILRPASATLNGQRLMAETRAIQAVAGCAPFELPPLSSRRTYLFNFTPGH